MSYFLIISVVFFFIYKYVPVSHSKRLFAAQEHLKSTFCDFDKLISASEETKDHVQQILQLDDPDILMGAVQKLQNGMRLYKSF